MNSECIDHGKRGTHTGYHVVSVKVHGMWRGRNLHRVVYAKHNGISLESLDGLVVRHTCDNPRCINPLHLIKGTCKDNSADMVMRNRQAIGESNGNSRLTVTQVIHIRSIYVKGSKDTGAKAIARLYSVGDSTIRSIVNNRTWKEI